MKGIAFILILLLAGCGSDSNPFENRFSPAAWCDDGRGGFAFEDGQYAYCNNGEYIVID